MEKRPSKNLAFFVVSVCGAIASLKLRFSVVSSVIQCDTDKSFKPSSYQEGFGPYGLRIEFLTTKIVEWLGRERELRISPNAFAVIMLVQLAIISAGKDPARLFASKWEILTRLLRRGFSSGYVRKLFRTADGLMRLPKDLQERFVREINALPEVTGMPWMTSFEEVAMEKGREQGLGQGLEQDRKSTRLNSSHVSESRMPSSA